MGQLVLAYHGCDVCTRDDLVKGIVDPVFSRNRYDWLGDGVYFFQDDHQRALNLAKRSAEKSELLLTKNPIATPSVVGAVLDVDRWFDLSTQSAIANFKVAAETLVALHESTGEPLPQNKSAYIGDDDKIHRAFDREVIILLHALRNQQLNNAVQALQQTTTDFQDRLGQGLAADSDDAKCYQKDISVLHGAVMAYAPYQASRAPFEQGASIGHTNAICEDSHIQIALHDLSCIRGWFLVPGDKMQTESEYMKAKDALELARKERVDLKKTKAKP